MDDAPPAAFSALLARRLACEPVAYITGTRDFWTIALHITPDVLIPRPDSETLIEAAVESLPREGALRFLDLGTGSGALLLAALDQWPESTGVGVDRSEEHTAELQSLMRTPDAVFCLRTKQRHHRPLTPL